MRLAIYNHAMLNELRILQAAFVMFTRLPLSSNKLCEQHFQLASHYLPIVGMIVGTISCIVFSLSNTFLSTDASTFIALVSAIIITGAIHEDGFADCCDGFGAMPSTIKTDESVNKILRIMKDSRLGTFAVLGLISMFIGRWQVLNNTQDEQILLALLSLFSLSKLPPLILMAKLNYIRAENIHSKMAGNRLLDIRRSLISAGIILLMLAIITPPLLLLFELISLIVLTLCCAVYFNTRLGGYNGDCLGACEQISGLSLLLVVAFYF